MSFHKSFDKLNILVKLILTIFLGPIIGCIYRISKGRIIIGILWFILVFPFVIDVVTLIVNKKYTFLV